MSIKLNRYPWHPFAFIVENHFYKRKYQPVKVQRRRMRMVKSLVVSVVLPAEAYDILKINIRCSRLCEMENILLMPA